MDIKSDYEKEVLELLKELVEQIRGLRDDVQEQSSKLQEAIYNN